MPTLDEAFAIASQRIYAARIAAHKSADAECSAALAVLKQSCADTPQAQTAFQFAEQELLMADKFGESQADASEGYVLRQLRTQVQPAATI